MRKRGRSSRAAMGLIVIIVMFICLLIMIKTNSLSETLEAKEARLAQINLDIARAGEETKDIENEIKYRETDDFIEDQARESLGLRYPDEIILVPKESTD